jgi:hypothetical protein
MRKRLPPGDLVIMRERLPPGDLVTASARNGIRRTDAEARSGIGERMRRAR